MAGKPMTTVWGGRDRPWMIQRTVKGGEPWLEIECGLDGMKMPLADLPVLLRLVAELIDASKEA
jgi:hypothetical protein